MAGLFAWAAGRGGNFLGIPRSLAFSWRLSMGTISCVICALNSTGARTFKHVWLLVFRSIWSSSCSDQMILSPSLTGRPFASLSVPLG